MLLGTAQAIITPPVGTPLAGFGFRDHGSESVLDDLELRVFWMQHDTDATRAACIVCADIIGFDAALTTQLKERLIKDHPLSSASILLCASHTHSGPQTCSNMIGVGALIPAVVTNLRDAVLAAVKSARIKLHPVELKLVHGRLDGYSINRRVVTEGHATSGPNPDGIRDDEVSTIVFSDTATGDIRALLYHFTCHPTTLGSYAISSEYPGAARRIIEKSLGFRAVDGSPQPIAGFLPGCFGDVRPNCTYIGGKQFRRGQPEDVAAFGSALGEVVIRSLSSINVADQRQTTASLRGRETIVNLPHAQAPSLNSPLTLQRLDLTDEITLLAMGGEVCCGYGRTIKQLPCTGATRKVVPLGYTNGITGYIPTAEMFSEGGYEVDDSVVYFSLPAPFSPAIDAIIKSAIHGLMA